MSATWSAQAEGAVRGKGLEVQNAPDGPPLLGGNSGIVVRQGETVRRPAGPWTPLVQRLMTELRAAGITIVPQPFGLDEHGREVIEFIEGDVGVYPMPGWVWTDALLVEVGEWLRRIHDATSALDLPMHGWRLPAVEPAEVVCHGDAAPYNVVCREGRLTAFIGSPAVPVGMIVG